MIVCQLSEFGYLFQISLQNGAFEKREEIVFINFKCKDWKIHLSENEGLCDDHNLIHSDSLQYKLIKENAESILQRGINVTLEARDQSFEDIRECYFMIEEILSF